MRVIDMESWSRREHFNLFKSYGYPHFGMCANVDLSAFYPAVKQRGSSFTVAVAYLISRASNAVPEFRYRIRGEDVVEYDIVHPGFTYLVGDDLFTFCIVDYDEEFSTFEVNAANRIAFIKENPTLENEPRDDVLYTTSIPWVSFTSFLHPMHLQPEDSIPRFVWGKFFKEGDNLKMPLGVQGHHAVIDGLHVGRFYEEIENLLQQPELIMGNSINK